MAEGLMRALLPSHELFSAGLCAPEGVPADPLAVALMREAGIDIASHRSRQLAGWMLSEAGQVYTMEAMQAAALRRSYPRFAGKIERLGELCSADIPDPYGQPQAAFEQCYAAIRRAVQSRLPPGATLPPPGPTILQGRSRPACVYS